MIANSLAKCSVPYLSDDRLVSEAKCGNRQAFGELCLRYSGMLRQRILAIVRHREDAEDVLQDTFLSAYQHLDGFRGACRFSTWLLAIGTNRSLMLLRKRKVLLKNTSDAVSEDGDTLAMECRDPALNPERRYMMHQTRKKLDDAIKNLSPRLRSVVELYYRRELRRKDAAEVMGISEVAIKSRIVRARRMLRRSLKQNECWTP
jgi:RNA polymerase sigma-70 factor, ECF subfamily